MDERLPSNTETANAYVLKHYTVLTHPLRNGHIIALNIINKKDNSKCTTDLQRFFKTITIRPDWYRSQIWKLKKKYTDCIRHIKKPQKLIDFLENEISVKYINTNRASIGSFLHTLVVNVALTGEKCWYPFACHN